MDQQQLAPRDRRSSDRNWCFGSDALGRQKMQAATQRVTFPIRASSNGACPIIGHLTASTETALIRID